jgi:hypothetical protein
MGAGKLVRAVADRGRAFASARDAGASSRGAAERSFCASLSSARLTRSTGEREGALRGELVLVEQPAEEVSTANSIEVDYLGK